MNGGWWIVGAVGAVWLGSLWLRRSVELPLGDDDGTLAQLVTSGHRIEAIRRFRARHGGGMKDAKEAVERLARGEKAALPTPASPSEITGEIEALIKAGRHLEAVKAYREIHPEADLTTAKEAVDRWGDRNN